MNTERTRYHPRLRVVILAAFTLVLSLTVAGIVFSYQTLLERRYEKDLRQQLIDGLSQLRFANFSQETVDALADQGIQILAQDLETGGLMVCPPRGLPAGFSGSEGQPPPTDRNRKIQTDLARLKELVWDRLENQDGSFFLTDEKQEEPRVPSLNANQLYLCGQAKGILFCLMLPVESTNAAVNLAIRYATIVGVSAWTLCVAVVCLLSRRLTGTHRGMAEVAARFARMDFSQRCPAGLSREMNELSQSINTMADALQTNLEGMRTANSRLQVELAERIRQQQLTTELVANLSHDLKTPIAIISGYAEGLQEGVAQTPEKQKLYYEMILKESQQMQATVTKLLSLCRLESGETPILPETFDLVAGLKGTMTAFQRELERLEIQLELRLPETCMVYADYERVRQCAVNYIQNAIYHMNGGKRLTVTLEDAGERVRLTVENSSAFISEEEAPKLWEKLYRGDVSRQRNRGASGLGLSIVKGNMERMGLPYGFYNDPSLPGVAFWLELPRGNPG